MKRREVDEISDEEWSGRDFKLSRVLPSPLAPRAIESFGYRRPQRSSVVLCVDSDSDGVGEARPPQQGGRGRKVVLDDSDEELAAAADEIASEMEGFGEEEVVELEEDEYEDEDEDDDDDDDDEDVVGRALQKCDKISASLRDELYGSSAAACDRYSEAEAASPAARIVTQEDVDAACASAESDFQPVLKPYQLVGVNFLLLLYRKNIGGAILADEMGLGKTIQRTGKGNLVDGVHHSPSYNIMELYVLPTTRNSVIFPRLDYLLLLMSC